MSVSTNCAHRNTPIARRMGEVKERSIDQPRARSIRSKVVVLVVGVGPTI